MSLRLFGKASILFTLTVILSGCNSTHDREKSFSCSCSDYFPSNEINTQFFSREIISEDIYQASGSTYCSGLQELDVEMADNKAKENLAKLISVNVETKESVTIGNAGYGVTVQEYLQNSNLESKLTVQGAYITRRWVDTNHCTIYSSARISKENADLSLASATQSLKQSTFYLKSSGNKAIDNQLFELFLAQGINKISEQDTKQKYLVEAVIINAVQSSDKVVELTLRVKILNRDNSEVFGSVSADGKGVSYKKLTYAELYNRAINDAWIELSPSLTSLLGD